MKEIFIEDDGIRLHMKLDMPKQKTKCPLVIVIPGFTGHMEERHIVGVAEAITDAGFASLRAEMYGHGKSGGRFEDHTLFKWISNAMAVIDYAKSLDFVTDLYVCGHSQGGLLTILVAGMRPHEIRAILPLAPALVIPDGARKGALLGMEFDPMRVPQTIVCGERTINGNYVCTAQMIFAEAAMERYHGPVLLVHGDADEAVPVQYSIDAAKKYEHSELVVIPGDTHCYDFHLDVAAGAVKKFLLSM